MDLNPKPIANPNQHLATDSLQHNLQRRSVRSGLIAVAAQPLKLAIGIGSTAILARLLTPNDFGLLAMVTPLLMFVDSLTNLGLETATVRQENLEHQQLSAIFWFSLQINAIVIGLMLLMAPVLAQFYRRSELTGMTFLLAIGAIALGVSYQHQALLKRQMRFGTLTLIEVVAITAGAIAAVVAAWQNWGYWALVLQLVVMQLFQSVAYWIVCGWRPNKPTFNKSNVAPLREMLSFGAHLTGFRFLTRIGMYLDRILIGYFSGATSLGLYQVAHRWAHFPFEQIYFPLFDVAVSSLSRAYRDPDLYLNYCRRGFLLLFSVCLPALAFCFVEAQNLLLLLLGEQWLDAVPLFQVLTIAVFVVSFYRVTKWLYVSAGQTQRQFRWGLIYTLVMSISMVIGAPGGTYGIAVAYTIATCLLTYPAIAYCLQTSPLSLRDFLSSVARPAIAAILAACILFLSQLTVPLSTVLILTLLIRSIIFAILYILIWLALPGGWQTATDIWQNLKLLRSN